MERKKLLENKKERIRRKIRKKRLIEKGAKPGKSSGRKSAVSAREYLGNRKGALSRIKGRLVSLAKRPVKLPMAAEGRLVIAENVSGKTGDYFSEKAAECAESPVRPAGRTRSGKRKPSLPKPKVAILSLASCGGCRLVLSDSGDEFLEFCDKIELFDFRSFDRKESGASSLDLVLVEGNPVTDADAETLKWARSEAKVLAALGNCAAMGGVSEIGNYRRGESSARQAYRYIQGVAAPEIKEISDFVKVDFVFPGCPISSEEFFRYMPKLLKGEIPDIPDRSVCYECRKAGNECLLLQGKPCFGSMILGGCGAACPESGSVCLGCRGLRPSGNVSKARKLLKGMMTENEFGSAAEIYGLRDDIDEKEKN